MLQGDGYSYGTYGRPHLGFSRPASERLQGNKPCHHFRDDLAQNHRAVGDLHLAGDV